MPTNSFADRFPDPAARTATSRHRVRRRAAFVCALATVIVAGLLVTSAFGSSGSDYRTASVTRRAVDATLDRVGTIEPVSQATVAFPVAGTVASVSVKVGDAVDVGTVLASLDGTSLTDALHQKEAALAQAQLTLSKALAGQSVGSPSAFGGNGSSGGSGSSSAGSGANATFQSSRSGSGSRIVLAAATMSTDPKIAAAQQAVLGAQQEVDAALTTASTALTTAQSVCAGATGTTATTSATSAGGAASTASSPAGTSQGDDLTACQKALQDVLTADRALADAQHALVDASNALDDLLGQQVATPPPSAPATPSIPSAPSSGSGGASRGSGGATSGFGSTGSGGSGATARASSPSAADLAAFQQNVDAAAAAVAVAQQALAQATITSPIAGKVVAVGLQPGDDVTASSATANVVVQGPGGYEVSTTVSVDEVAHVAVGQRATVVPDGTHTALTGSVTSVAVAPDSSSNTYLVVIGLTKPDATLHNGATGSAAIVTQSAKSALAVPTSAVTTTGTRHTVLVPDGDSTRRVAVRVGAVGTTWTEITSGLRAGDRVVIADVSAPLPGSATASTNGTSGTGQNRTFTGFPGFGGRGGLGGGAGR
ncbi:MAG TPA: efflux RND transporter periplasmic adaptor subunit [Acidimicrobiia bacterium]|jgi:HlyD family secretion protein